MGSRWKLDNPLENQIRNNFRLSKVTDVSLTLWSGNIVHNWYLKAQCSMKMYTEVSSVNLIRDFVYFIYIWLFSERRVSKITRFNLCFVFFRTNFSNIIEFSYITFVPLLLMLRTNWFSISHLKNN